MANIIEQANAAYEARDQAQVSSSDLVNDFRQVLLACGRLK